MHSEVQKQTIQYDHSSGFTVVELMVTLTALAIIILIGIPGASMLKDQFSLKSTSSNLYSSLALAKEESVARSSVVRVCPSSNGHTCRTDNNWNLGWLVYSDGNGDSAVQDIELIKAFKAPNPRIRIHATGAVQNRASFNSTGLVQENDTTTGMYRICIVESNVKSKMVTVSSEGWVDRQPVNKKAAI